MGVYQGAGGSKRRGNKGKSAFLLLSHYELAIPGIL